MRLAEVSMSSRSTGDERRRHPRVTVSYRLLIRWLECDDCHEELIRVEDIDTEQCRRGLYRISQVEAGRRGEHLDRIARGALGVGEVVRREHVDRARRHPASRRKTGQRALGRCRGGHSTCTTRGNDDENRKPHDGTPAPQP